jgi:hypothetical protein
LQNQRFGIWAEQYIFNHRRKEFGALDLFGAGFANPFPLGATRANLLFQIQEMKRLLFIPFTLILFSCHKPRSTMLENILESQCFWDITEEKKVFGGLNSCFRFLPQGECYFYYYIFYDKKRTDSVFIFDHGDVVNLNKWSILGDSVLIARGTQYNVLSYSNDSVVIEAWHDTLILRKNCKTNVAK